jgi:hypothetical protein
MTEQQHTAAASPPSSAEAIQWAEQWLSPEEILRTETLQVRHKLDSGAIRQYRDMTRAGKVPPLIKVAEVTEGDTTRHYLVDGWHRWEAGALITDGQGLAALVRVLAAPMSMREAAWVAAEANLSHGVQLKRTERVEVFKVFVHAAKHRTRKGYLSYRDMAGILGTPSSTLQRWMHKHFRSIAERMGGTEGPAPGGLTEAPEMPTVADGVVSEVKRLQVLAISLEPEDKHRVATALRDALAAIGKTDGAVVVDEF